MTIDFSSRRAILDAGFQGFVSVRVLTETKCSNVPAVAGVYLVLRPSRRRPIYREESQGGHYRGDLSVSVSCLKANGVKYAIVLYIGQAGGSIAGRATESTLRKRLQAFMRFGAGNSSASHTGGKYIWQLENCSELILYWKPTGSLDAGLYEKQLIAHFTETYGARPFANLKD